jgi:hypothetical protein
MVIEFKNAGTYVTISFEKEFRHLKSKMNCTQNGIADRV